MESGEIKDYADDGHTALCPHCGNDAVLPDASCKEIDEHTLTGMHNYWF